ncbi:MAG: G-D-S-L family lipolytic protein [Chitinophagaceae bacterium]|nr:G-D-S-L family lipolytic protein [Chitinophagaceae bacterium]
MRLFFKIIVTCFLFLSSENVLSQQYPFADAIKAFKEQDKIKMPEKNAILFIGSSSFTFWKDIQDYFPGYPIINRGFGGSTLKDLIYYADDVVKPYHPRQVVIYCGENDLTEPNVDATVVFDRFKILFNLIRKHYPGVPVTYVSMKPSPSRKKFRADMEAGNAAIRYFLDQHENTSYVDVYRLMLLESGQPIPDIFKSDSLHMNAEGYKIWQKEIAPYLIK